MLIIGGGKVGSFLAKELSRAGHVVTIIEEDEDRAAVLSEGKVLVFHGDGTDVDLLKSADVDRADWVLGVTGRDEHNLVACQLAKTLGAKNTLARLNDPRNRETFDALEIRVVAVTDLMGEIISQEVAASDLHRIALMAGGRVSLIERSVADTFPTTPLADLELPTPTILVTIVRGDEVIVPTGTSELRAGDRVLAVTTLDNEKPFCDALARLGNPDRG